MSDEIVIDKSEPCEQCGEAGDSGLYWPAPDRMVVWCGRCYRAWAAQQLATKEAALLASWGTRGNRRAS